MLTDNQCKNATCLSGANRSRLGVAEYQLVESLPATLQASLPSIEQIESELQALDQ